MKNNLFSKTAKFFHSVFQRRVNLRKLRPAMNEFMQSLWLVKAVCLTNKPFAWVVVQFDNETNAELFRQRLANLFAILENKKLSNLPIYREYQLVSLLFLNVKGGHSREGNIFLTFNDPIKQPPIAYTLFKKVKEDQFQQVLFVADMVITGYDTKVSLGEALRARNSLYPIMDLFYRLSDTPVDYEDTEDKALEQPPPSCKN